MRVETSRMIPVIHAKLFRTSTTEPVALVWLASSSRLEMCNEDGASIMDSKNDEASFVDITSPAIFPIQLSQTKPDDHQGSFFLTGIKGAVISKGNKCVVWKKETAWLAEFLSE